MVKESPYQCRRCRGHGFVPWVVKMPWSRKWLSTSVFLPGKFHGQRSLVGYSPWSCKEFNVAEHTHTHTHTHTYTHTHTNITWYMGLFCLCARGLYPSFQVNSYYCIPQPVKGTGEKSIVPDRRGRLLPH